jgi:hypothetical protein
MSKTIKDLIVFMVVFNSVRIVTQMFVFDYSMGMAIFGSIMYVYANIEFKLNQTLNKEAK